MQDENLDDSDEIDSKATFNIDFSTSDDDEEKWEKKINKTYTIFMSSIIKNCFFLY